MSLTRRALEGFNAAISEASDNLEQAKQIYQGNPEDEAARDRYTKLSTPEGFPDVHKAAVAFQEALHSTSKKGHTRGWAGGEGELEELQMTAQTHGLDPGLFVTPEGAGTQREHVLQLTRLYNGKFLPGDGRSDMWDPQAHSFQTGEDAQSFAGMIGHYYPDLQPEVNEGQMQGQQVGDDGQPMPTMEPTWSVSFTHEELGEPFPPGTSAHANSSAQQRSSQMPHPHHVVTDPTGTHSMSLEPGEGQQVVNTYQGGQLMPPPEAPPEGEEQAPAGEQPPGEAPQAAPPEGVAPAAAPAQATQGVAPARESLDAVDRLLAESGYVVNEWAETKTNQQWHYKTALDIYRAHKVSQQKAGSQRGKRGRQEVGQWHTHDTIRDLVADGRLPKNLHKMNERALKRAAGERLHTDDVGVEMDNELSEMLALFRASNKRAPALMMEALPVDSNRGVTARGNSHFDRYASPETREKVLESRMQEIEAFANSRKLQPATVYAIAEAAMRTGKIPDLGQFGMAGDDAVATKQFLISNVLNIQGLEWKDYKGDPVVETEEKESESTWDKASKESETSDPNEAQLDPSDPRRFMAESHGASGKTISGGMPLTLEPTRPAVKRKQRYPAAEDNVNIDPASFMSESSGGKRRLERRMTVTINKGASHDADAIRYAQRREQRPPGEREQVAALAKKNKALKKHGYPGVASVPQEFQPPRRPGWGTIGQKVGEQSKKLKQARGVETSSVEIDSASSMSEEGGPYRTGGGPERAPLSPSLLPPGPNAPIDAQSFMKQPLLPKEILSKLRKEMGDRVEGFSRWELLDIARERGLLGTEESVQEDDIRQTRVRRAARAASGEIKGPGGHIERTVLGAIGRGETPSKYMKGRNPREQFRAQAAASKVGGHGMTPDEKLRRLALARTPGFMGQLSTQAATAKAAGFEDREIDPDLLLGEDAAEILRLIRPLEKTLGGAQLDEHDYQGCARKHGGKFKGYVQPHQAIYEFASEDGATQFASFISGKTTATPTVKGKRVSVDEPMMGESHLGYAGTSSPTRPGNPHNAMGTVEAPPTKEEKEEDEKPKAEDTRTQTDKILGIEDGDPRAEAWPKISSEMQNLLNLENCSVFSAPRGFRQEEPEPVEEATLGGASVGGFIGGGMMMPGGGMVVRNNSIPSYDASQEVSKDDLETKKKKMADLLKKLGLR